MTVCGCDKCTTMSTVDVKWPSPVSPVTDDLALLFRGNIYGVRAWSSQHRPDGGQSMLQLSMMSPVHNTVRGPGGEPVQMIARYLLVERLDELTDEALRRLMRLEPAYAALTIDAGQRRRGMRSTLELALSRVAGHAIPPLERRATTVVGRERAEQGFPLAALMRSFQLDLRVLWEAVMAEGHTRHISTSAHFLEGLIRVWEATDANTVEVVQAYSRTEREIAQARNELRARSFERLLLDSDTEPACVTRAASLLGLPTDLPVLVLVGDGVSATADELRHARAALEQTSTAHHLGWVGDELIGLFIVGRRGEQVVREALAPLSAYTCGLARVETLAETALGLRLARAAVRGVVEPGVHALQSRWLEAFATVDDELGAALVRTTLRRLLAAPERDALLETLDAYARVGSVARAAEETYRHRNTVRNRLRAAEELCGLDLSVPRDSAILALALAWWQAHRQQS